METFGLKRMVWSMSPSTYMYKMWVQVHKMYANDNRHFQVEQTKELQLKFLQAHAQ